jgi:pilus assembly protein CpaE
MVHPDAATRQAIEQTLRGVLDGAVYVDCAETPTEALDHARRMDPQVILLDLDDQRALALDAARTLRQPNRLIIGLYNPLVLDGSESQMLRESARAGVSDFVALPVSEAELAAALDGLRRLTDAGPAREGRLMAFFSHKGGVGTTTLAVHTALALASSGQAGDTVLCDAHVPFGDAAGMLGLDPDRDLADLVADLDQQGPMDSFSIRDPRTGLHVIASPREAAAALLLTPEQLGRALIALRRRFASVIVDLPSSLDLFTMAALDLADAIGVVTEPVPATVRRTAELLNVLEQQGVGADRVRVILNKEGWHQKCLPAAQVAARLGREVSLTLPFDSDVVECSAGTETMFVSNPKSEFARGIMALAQELVQRVPAR